MRALVLLGPGRVELAEVPDPEILDRRDALVRVERAGLCGSDLHPYLGREPAAAGVVPGHEAAGVVEAVGSAVTGFAPGDRVIVPFSTSCGRCGPCRRGLTARCVEGRLLGWGPPGDPSTAVHGAQAERLRVPLADGTLVAWPDGLGAEAAVLCSDNLPTAREALDRSVSAPDGGVAVVGCGAVGLCVVALAVEAGGGEVVAVDPVAERRRRAAALGAVALTPDRALRRRGAFGTVVEAAGTRAAQRIGFELVGAGGTLSVIAVQTAETFGFDPFEAYDRNLRVAFGRASVRSTLGSELGDPARREAWVRLANRVAEVVVTHGGVPLERGPEVYRAFAERAGGVVKATFVP